MKYRCTIEVEVDVEDFRAVAEIETRLKEIARSFQDVATGHQILIREMRRR